MIDTKMDLSNANDMPESRVSWFKRILKQYDRIAITGTPRGGKSTLAKWSDRKVIHSDDYMSKEWSEASQAVADTVNLIKGKIVVEGTAVSRALRKGMKVDVVILVVDPLQELTKGQLAMSKGVKTVLDGWAKLNPDIPILIAPEIPYDHRRDYLGYHNDEE